MNEIKKAFLIIVSIFIIYNLIWIKFGKLGVLIFLILIGSFILILFMCSKKKQLRDILKKNP